MAAVKDPICGMMIDPKYAAGTSTFEGTTFYFCSPGCKRTFDKDPAKHARAA
jgi:Cu+-exporting ATPase